MENQKNKFGWIGTALGVGLLSAEWISRAKNVYEAPGTVSTFWGIVLKMFKEMTPIAWTIVVLMFACFAIATSDWWLPVTKRVTRRAAAYRQVLANEGKSEPATDRPSALITGERGTLVVHWKFFRVFVGADTGEPFIPKVQIKGDVQWSDLSHGMLGGLRATIQFDDDVSILLPNVNKVIYPEPYRKLSTPFAPRKIETMGETVWADFLLTDHESIDRFKFHPGPCRVSIQFLDLDRNMIGSFEVQFVMPDWADTHARSNNLGEGVYLNYDGVWLVGKSAHQEKFAAKESTTSPPT